MTNPTTTKRRHPLDGEVVRAETVSPAGHTLRANKRLWKVHITFIDDLGMVTRMPVDAYVEHIALFRNAGYDIPDAGEPVDVDVDVRLTHMPYGLRIAQVYGNQPTTPPTPAPVSNPAGESEDSGSVQVQSSMDEYDDETKAVLTRLQAMTRADVALMPSGTLNHAGMAQASKRIKALVAGDATPEARAEVRQIVKLLDDRDIVCLNYQALIRWLL